MTRIKMWVSSITLLLLIGVSYGGSSVNISKDALGFAEVNINQSDPGVRWMYNAWQNAKRKNSLKTIAGRYGTHAAIVGIYPSSGVMEFPYVIVSRIQPGIHPANLEKIMASDIKGRYSPQTYNNISLSVGSKPDGRKFAFYQNGASVVIGTSLEALNKTIDVSNGKISSIKSDADWADLTNRLSGNRDMEFFFTNNSGQFASALARQERKWKMSLLLSSRSIQAISGGMNFVDGDRMTGVLVFKAKSPAAIRDIQDDANFLGEAIRRKFSKQKITYKRQVTVQGNYVTLSYEMSGMKPLFNELFRDGISSLLR